MSYYSIDTDVRVFPFTFFTWRMVFRFCSCRSRIIRRDAVRFRMNIVNVVMVGFATNSAKMYGAKMTIMKAVDVSECELPPMYDRVHESLHEALQRDTLVLINRPSLALA